MPRVRQRRAECASGNGDNQLLSTYTLSRITDSYTNLSVHVDVHVDVSRWNMKSSAEQWKYRAVVGRRRALAQHSHVVHRDGGSGGQLRRARPRLRRQLPQATRRLHIAALRCLNACQVRRDAYILEEKRRQ